MTDALPSLDEAGGYYWRSGLDGVLRIGWCKACAIHLHPSTEVCPHCLGTAVEPVAVTGHATVVACTENRQQWLPGHPPPYVVAIVALSDAPVRLTTNIVGCAPSDVHVGMPVQVRFEQHGDVWLPVFAPVPGALPNLIIDELPTRSPPTAIRRNKFEDKVAITGIGQSVLGRRLAESSLVLTIDACRAAIADSSLARQDIDGICAYPGSDGLPGVSDGGVRAVERVLGLQPVWHCGMHEVPGQTGNLIAAMLAVAAGLCRHVLCFTSFSQSRRPGARGLLPAGGRISGELAWQLPYGAASPANWIALYASHYLAKYRLDREVLAGVAIAARRHAARNPLAIYAEQLSLEDYLSARLISWPFGLYDCDVPCDGAMAVIISHREVAADLAHKPVLVESVGTRITEHQSWDQGELTHQRNVFGPATHLWSRTELTCADVDVALLYDGFTFNVFSWLEGLGFCPPGDAAAFIAGGARIGPGGRLPLNTHGGQLAAGRTNGYGNVIEAVQQLRGLAGARQVERAQVAVVSSGGGIPASCMLLRKDS